MKKSVLSVLTALLITQSVAFASEVEYSGLAEISTGTILGSDDFSVSGVQKSRIIDEGMQDNSSALTTIGGGLDATNRQFKFQLIGSLGRLSNGDLTSNVVKVDAAAYYMGAFTNKVGIGFHVSNLSFVSPSWSGNADIKLGDSNALAEGIAVIFGDELAIKATLDYVTGSKFSVDSVPNGVVVSKKSISIDGTMAQVALLYKF